MGDEKSLESVHNLIKEFGGNVPTISSPKMIDYFDANTELYNAALNNLFACAIVNSKAQIYNDIEAATKSSGGFYFLKESSLKDYIPPLKQKNSEDATLYKCRAIGTSSNESIKREEMTDRLINTSSYLTCRYLAYTRYVKNVAEQE